MATEFIKLILLPSNLTALLIMAGLGSLFYHKTRRYAARLFFAGGVVFLVFANGPVSYYLIHRLETQNPAFDAERHPAGFEDIIVLTGHALPDPRLPVSSTVNSSSAFRILETLRLHRAYPGARITISGSEEVPMLMQRLLASLGVKEALIALEANSRNTFESAVHLKERMQGREFILVTSAGHMPRSLGAFRQMGMDPTPAPTDYLAKMGPFDGNLLPNLSNLMRADLAVHEYFGMLWYGLKAYGL